MNLDEFRTPHNLDKFRHNLDKFRTPRFTDATWYLSAPPAPRPSSLPHHSRAPSPSRKASHPLRPCSASVPARYRSHSISLLARRGWACSNGIDSPSPYAATSWAIEYSTPLPHPILQTHWWFNFEEVKLIDVFKLEKLWIITQSWLVNKYVSK